MPLIQGEQLGHYKIQSLIGKGGMGEVYRARDTHLGRDVAIKVLPPAVSRDPERRARFEREAKVLAALNHPNIATIYGIEQNALVMELVEGETLPRGLDLETALRYARQIAEALEAAHDKGIVHRDLKPANIKITPDGAVKVLDFGLATAVQREEPEPADPAASPTLTMAATETGVILGTAAYMSPEQAAGKRVDKRADIWSFGVVLWEMLSGKRLFGAGETVSHVLADVLRAPIDFGQLAAVPSPIIALLRRCLDRDVKTRLRDIGEARIAIVNYLTNPGMDREEQPRKSAPVAAWTIAAVCTLIAGALAYLHFHDTAQPSPALRMQLNAPAGATDLAFALSPDGRYLALSAAANGKAQLWLRPLDSPQAQALPGTEDATYPFWSPDSRYIGFFAQGKLKKILASGGPPQIVCDADNGRGASWNREDAILFSADDGGGFAIRRVSASGGTPAVEYKAPHGIIPLPAFLPDGRHFLYVVTRASPEENGIYFRSADGKENRRVLPDESSVTFAAGRLLFIRENTLIAQPFEPDTGQATGDPIQLAPGVPTTSSVVYAPVTASGNGMLIYQSGGSAIGNNELVWFDRSGTRGERLGGPSPVLEPAISPDGKSVAFTRQSNSGSDLWIWDLARSTERRLTTDPAFQRSPSWSPRADRIVFQSNRAGGINDIYQRAVSGTGGDETVLAGPTRKKPTQWTRDGKLMVYTNTDPNTKDDIWTLPMENGKPGTPAVFLHSQFVEDSGQLSPDGNWMTYTSNESGRNEIYVRAFPSGEEQKKISAAGGQESKWRSDGKELYFTAADGKMMAVPIKIGPGPKPTFYPGAPLVLFPAPALAHNSQGDFAYDVTPDGKRFLLATVADNAGSPTVLDVIVNWDKARP